MSNVNQWDLSADDWDELNFPRPIKQGFDRVVKAAISRRGVLGGVLAFGSGAAVMGTGLLKGSTAMAQQTSRFAFEQLAPQTDGTVHVPAGYNWHTLVRWGDPLFSDAPAFDAVTGVPTTGSDRVFGENTDGMELFNLGNTELLVVNSEYVNTRINLPDGQDGKAISADDIVRLQNFQGVSVMEVTETADGWKVVVDSPYNRRIHHRSPMTIDGPAAAGFKRYGVSTKVDPGRYNYHGFDARFDLSNNPNEPHRAGYIVEIDPWNPDSTPVKHTALGRFKHENAACALALDGRVVVYMGDDERGEYIYKWVSRDVYVPGGDTATLLSEGQLFVARFNDDGTGIWLALTPEDTGMTKAEIAIFTRMAGTAVSATTMDRPEWVAVNPTAVEAYCCLTNNVQRGATNDDESFRTNAAGEPMITNAPNPRNMNRYGQIVRWRPHGDEHAAPTFDWDLYVMAGNPTVHGKGPYAGTANINAGNLFNSPDGMHSDTTGLLWIQTDGNDGNDGDFVGMGNNQMLAGDPVTGEIRRFLTGPKGAEVTGLTWSADKRTMFVGIQHPDRPFPDGEHSLPRSSIIVVKCDDNALIG
ncbi:MAG: PhoX family phosphatase [Rhodobacteraceae bacterium]|nr:PhoX family phosphatase [Paracoccaceae bacterium]